MPELGIDFIKAKIDTGARTSALHAIAIRRFRRGGERWVRFRVHPVQRDARRTVEAEAPVLEEREVRSSTGHVTSRPVIVTDLRWLEDRFPIELTLVSRDEMGFRMLLGREAVRGRYLVDAGRSYVGGRPGKLAESSKRREAE